MKIMKNWSYISRTVAGMALLALVSCAKEQESQPEVFKGVPAVVDVTLMDMDQPQTRHNVSKTDGWTTSSFTGGDRIGMMATNGLVLPEGGTGWIKNGYLENTQALGSSTYRFRNDNLLLNTGVMTGKVARYVYYPYTEDMPVPVQDATSNPPSAANQYDYANPRTTDTANKTIQEGFRDKKGLLLRRTPGDDLKPVLDAESPARCVDYMYISNISLSNGALSGGFYHGFCELVILRGTGFDKKLEHEYDLDHKMFKDEIRVVLDYGYTRLTLGIHLTYTTGQLTFMPALWPGSSWSSWTYDTDFPADEKRVDGLTEWEAKRWTTWPGEQYIDSKDGLPVPRDAWYVILPSAHSRSHPTVESIEIFNNDGKFCEVSNFDLYVDPNTGVSSKPSYAGKRFTVDIMMTEHGATARPCEISDWSTNDGNGQVKDENGEVIEDNANDITDIRTVGIKDADVFEDWAQAYQVFLTALEQGSFTRPTTKEALDEITHSAFTNLKAYGDYNITDGRWQFYINGEINFEGKSGFQVSDLQDQIGGSSQSINYPVYNLGIPLFLKISGKGEVHHLDFENLYIKVNPGVGNAAGALTNALEGGTILNCNILAGTLIGTSGAVGMLAGSVMNGGTVKNCSISGAVIGDSFGSALGADPYYPGGLFGLEPQGTLTCEEVDAKNLIVRK